MNKPKYGGKNRMIGFDFIEKEMMKLKEISILEIGSLRFPDSWDGHGCATLFFAWLVNNHPKAKFVTVDIDPKCIDNAVKATNKLGISNNVKFITADAIDLFKGKNVIEKLDCVYLDGWDYFPNSQSEKKHFELFKLVDEYIKVGGYLLIDDMYSPTSGKGELIIPNVLESKRYIMVIHGYMVVLKKIKE